MDQISLDDFVSVTQAARILGGVSISLVRWYGDTGRLTVIRDPAGRRLILKASVEALKQMRQTQRRRKKGR